MKTKRISNFSLISIAIVASFFIIIITTITKIRDNQNDKLLYAMESKIKYYAKRCYLENNCDGEITLKELYNKKYLKEEIVNPVTKEILDGNIKINYFNNEVILNLE